MWEYVIGQLLKPRQNSYVSSYAISTRQNRIALGSAMVPKMESRLPTLSLRSVPGDHAGGRKGGINGKIYSIGNDARSWPNPALLPRTLLQHAGIQQSKDYHPWDEEGPRGRTLL